MSTKIEWATETWNPIVGCSKISEGCRNCYAEKMAWRLGCMHNKAAFGDNHLEKYYMVTSHAGWNGRIVFDESVLYRPLKWKKPRRVFVGSMTDVFHKNVQHRWLSLIWGVMASLPQHTFMVLTKRPHLALHHFAEKPMIPKNIWIGVTAEDQKQADKRIPILLTIPAAVRFVSFEPLLDKIDPVQCKAVSYGPCGGGGESGPVEYDGGPNIDWVIVGAETGSMKRFMPIDNARHVRDWCIGFGIPFFFKKDSYGCHELDGQTWEQFPNLNIPSGK